MPPWLTFCVGCILGICAGYWLADDSAKAEEERRIRRRRSGRHLDR